MNIINFISHKFVVWGIGRIGKAFINSLNENKIIAIIDSDPKLKNTFYNNIPIITLNDYIKSYIDYFIIVTPIIDNDIVHDLKSNNITKYFILSDCPVDCIPFDDIASTNFILPDKNAKSVAIYGATLYSLAVFFYWKSKAITHVKLINENTDLFCLTDEIVETFSLKDDVVSIKQIDENYTVYSTLYSANIAKNKLSRKVIDLFENENTIKQRENLDLKKFKNSHKNKRCFIVATGPSLTTQDLDVLHSNNEITFSMNNIFPAFYDTLWRPSYYCVSDRDAIEKWEDDIKNNKIEAKFVSRYCKAFWTNYKDENTYMLNASFDKYKGIEFEELKFSHDISKIVYSEYTVNYVCLQLALYMGFKEIYLLGTDFSNKGHFNDDYHGKGVSNIKELDISYHLNCYKKANSEAKKVGVKIFNATRGGYLEVFERVNFDDLF